MGKFLEWLKQKEESRRSIKINIILWSFLLLINIYFLIFSFENNIWMNDLVRYLWILASAIIIYSSWKKLRGKQNETHSSEI